MHPKEKVEEEELGFEEPTDRDEALHQMLALQLCDIDTVAAVIEAEDRGLEG